VSTKRTTRDKPSGAAPTPDVSPAAAGEPQGVVNLGARLRSVRQAAGLSVREAARQLGVSASFVSQLENGKSQPSVATLYSLSQLLDVTIDQLFGTDADFEARVQAHEGQAAAPAAGGAVAVGSSPAPPVSLRPPSRSDFGSPADAWPSMRDRSRLSVTKPGDRRRLVMDTGVSWEQLANNTGSDLDFIEVVYPVGASSTTDNRMLRHDGYEYGYLLDGELEVTVGFDTFTLRAGEAVGFDSAVPHLFTNKGDIPARGIWYVRHPHQ
jgi:transcriptional regulator with XRE-family HTH domain/quercetin dioxygenase-like cupin family protein